MRLRERPPTVETSDEFIQWLTTCHENEAAYLDREIVWELAEDLRQCPNFGAFMNEARDLIAQRGDREPGGNLATRRRLAIPAAVIAGIIIVGVVSFIVMTRSITADYVTGKGEQREVALPDGSSVLLNTATRIRTRFSQSQRVVDIDAGEALFAVEKDPRRPFEVRAKKGVSTAVGTEFDVRLKEAHTEISVLEGTVSVTTEATGKSGVDVSAGQAREYSNAGDVCDTRPVNAQRIIAWRTHRILFDDIPLKEAIAEYNLYGSVPIVLKTARLEDRHVHGLFRIGDEPSFLRALEQGLPLRAVQNGSQIELRDR